MPTISVEKLAAEIAAQLEDYSEEVTDNLKKIVEQVAEECNEEIKKNVTFTQRSGDYVRAFKIKTIGENEYSKRKCWYVSGAHYRLTHLLENGHAKVNGGRTKAYPHIKFGDELINKRMPELFKEAIK